MASAKPAVDAERLRAYFAAFGPVLPRRMFGGYGVFYEGLMIALALDDLLYLKTDAVSRVLFERAGSHPFVYDRGARPVTMSYFSAPAEFFKRAEATQYWGMQAYDAAQRASHKSAGRKKRRAKPRPPAGW